MGGARRRLRLGLAQQDWRRSRAAAPLALPAALLLPRLQRSLDAARRLPLALPPRLHLLRRLHRHRHRQY